MKNRIVFILIMALLIPQAVYAEESEEKGFFGGIGSWISDRASEAWDWTTETASDAWDKTTEAASDAWNWTSEAATSAWNWTAEVATGAWDGVTGFFDPPSTQGTPSIAPEPELPAGTQKMYLGYEPVKTGHDNGYSGEHSIGRDDPHFGLTLGKFYISGFTSAKSDDNDEFIFLKTVGDDVELHYELVQDIDMLGGDTFITIHSDDGGYDKYFGISSTYFGRGTLIVRHTDYQNNKGKPQIYADYLSAKMTGDADTVISLNEEGDYEIALDYEIRKDSYILGTKATKTDYSNYRVSFTIHIRNGNCMVFPFDIETGEELKNTAFVENGFYLDLAYSRYLDINVKRSVLVEGEGGVTEDVRFNRPARDGEQYDQEGIYTIAVKNRYTGEETTKTLYVGTDQRLKDYVAQGMGIEQIIGKINS